MHDHDFEIITRTDNPDGTATIRVRIHAMNLERDYEIHPNGAVRLVGDPIILAGHDMTSITGKRIREWLSSRGMI